jgi:hypothetical protein
MGRESLVFQHFLMKNPQYSCPFVRPGSESRLPLRLPYRKLFADVRTTGFHLEQT